MIWTNIFKKACNLCFLGAAAGFLLFNANIAQAACKGIIFVGDSRTVGMAQVDKKCIQGNPSSVDCQGTDGNYWYAKVGVSFSFLSGGISKVNGLIANYDKVVIALGANDLGDPKATEASAKAAAQKYINSLKKSASSWIASGKKVYFSLVTPVDETLEAKNGYYVKNSNIKIFNNAIKSGLAGTGIGVIDASGSVSANNYSDGIHYKSYTNIRNSIYSQACAGGDGKKGGDTSSGTSAENDCDLLSPDKKTCQTACAKYYPMPTNAYTECSAKCSTNSDFQYKNCITKQNAAASTTQSPITNDVALSGKSNCNSSASSQSLGRDSRGNVSTCSTVQKMKNNGSRSALANYGNECSTTASSCNSAAIKTTAQYRDQGSSSCFQGMPIKNTTGSSISSVVGMRPVEIGARSSSCVLDGDTGVKMRQHQGMDVGTACGTPLEAPADGVIELTRTNFGDGSGKWIKIRHDMNPNSIDAQTGCNYYYTVFYHLSEISKTGKVKKGETVGKVGNGGGVYSCHMHMEVHKCNPHGELLNPLCSNNENLCNDKAGVSAVPINPIGSIGSGNGVRTNPYLGSKEDCDLFDLEECQKEPKDAKCPTKTKTKEQCEERNAEIDRGGEYCPPSEDGKKAETATNTDDKSCVIKKWAGITVPAAVQNALSKASQETGVPITLLAAMVAKESRFNPAAKAYDGGQGAIQFQPSTWAAYTNPVGWHDDVLEPSCQTRKIVDDCHPRGGKHTGIKSQDQYVTVYGKGKCSGDVFNPYDNIKCGAILYLDSLKDLGNDQDCAIMAHNAGAGNAAKGTGARGYRKNHGGSCSTAGYVADIHKKMNEIAKSNNCSLDALGSGGSNCENFNYADGFGGGSLYGQLYAHGGVEMSDFDSAYECNIAEHSNSVKGCIFCDMFKTIFNASSKVARQCHKTFSDSLVTLVAIGLAISLAYMIIPYLSNMTVQDPHRFINDIIQRVFIVVVIILLLKMDVTQFFDMFITPIFTTGMKLSELAISTEFAQKVSEYSFSDIDGSGLPQEMAVGMLRAIYAVQVRLEQMWALGANSICIAFFVKSYHHYPIFPHFGYLLTGLFMMLSAVIFMLIYPFLLIDAVLQFAIASSLLPLAIAATAFKPTRQYLNLMKILSIFINAMFIFIFLTIVMFVLLSGIDEAVRPHIEKAYSDSSANNLFDIREIGWYTQTFIKIIFFVFLGKAVLDDIPSFAEKFGGAFSYGSSFDKPDMGIGRKVGGTAVGAATNVAKTVGGTAWKATKGVGRGAKSFVGAAAKEGRRTYLINKTRRKASALAVGAAAGTATAAGAAWVSGRTWYGRKVQRRVVTDEKGNTVLETRKRSLIGNRRIINQDDGNMAITKKMNKDGSITETYNIKTPYGKNLINADGTKNKDAIEYLKQSSGLSKDALNKVLLNQMMKERLSGVKRGMGKEFLKDNSFMSEEIYSSVDDKGREVFEVRRVGKDGYVNVFKMTKGETRDLIEYERIDKKGNAKKWASDGVIQMKMGYKYEVDGNGRPVLNDDGTFKRKAGENDFCEFSNSKAYKGVKIFDKDGRRAVGMENVELMFSDVDLQSYQHQMKQYGDVLKHHAFGK